MLLVHDDPDVLDWLTALLEAAGYRVVIAATAFAARARLERDAIAALVVGWSAGGGAGEALASWAAGEPGMPERMAALADEAAEVAAAEAAGVAVFDTAAYQELLEFAERAVSAGGGAAAADFVAEPLAQGRAPRLLLVEDDVHQVRFIRDILGGYGFDVSITENASEAIGALEAGDFDVVLSDWYMDGGGGEKLYDWLIAERPAMLDRCVFMTGGGTRAVRERAPAASCYPKGQDSRLLIAALTRAARRAGAAS